MYQNLSQLVQLTGFAKETVAKRLMEAGIEPIPDSPGNAKMFDSTLALPALYNSRHSGQSELMQERARVARATAEAKERANLMERRELLTSKEARTMILGILARLRDFLNSLTDIIANQLERDGYTLTSEQYNNIQSAIDATRNIVADELLAFAATLATDG